ncbi:MAG TPA: dienelactone hydrolase family protein [Bryobacteraceae bacterium]|nr:dienelactone hydrolase family protein [Bryobacteraceae bacterium]
MNRPSLLMLLLSAIPCAAQTLPGTKPLTWEGELDVRMMDGAHRFVEREIAASVISRQRHWKRDIRDYAASIAPNRRRFLEKIGAVDALATNATMERFGDDVNPALAAETPLYRIFQVRWPAIDGVHGEGLLIEPLQPASAFVVALPDADQSPEQISGLEPGLPRGKQLARVLAESGCMVLVPVLTSRQSQFSGRPDIRMTDQPHREWLYRQAFQMGRHVIGYEVQKLRAAIEWSRKRNPGLRTGVAGYGEGGLIAFYAAAADPRIDAALVSGYFNNRQRVWAEPIFRNVWGLLEEFGDAEIATLIAPRGLVVEQSDAPLFHSTKGDLDPIDADAARREFDRIGQLLPNGFQQRSFIQDNGVKPFLDLLGNRTVPVASDPHELRRDFNPSDRQRRAVKEIEAHVQKLITESERTRADFFLLKAAPYLKEGGWSTKLRHPTHPAGPFTEAARPYRELFRREVIGRFDEQLLPPNARTRRIYDREKWAGYDVVLDVYPDLFAWGVLLIPKDLRPGERRPVVVCQHGRNGLPKDLIEPVESPYNQVAAKLADRGYIVFVPHNLYRAEDRYRWLSRKANSIKVSLFSFITAQHDQILNWLETLPFVDGKRMGFYGLSYGGETAVRLPALLEKYALSICSGDFNQWTRKVASTDEAFSFMYTIEWEMPYFNMGNTFDYSELSYLIFPRPFMVERGHHDLVGRDRWVAYEYAKTRGLYSQLEMEDRTEIEYFNGGHAMNAEGTFRFLAKHLNWPRGDQSLAAIH